MPTLPIALMYYFSGILIRTWLKDQSVLSVNLTITEAKLKNQLFLKPQRILNALIPF